MTPPYPPLSEARLREQLARAGARLARVDVREAVTSTNAVLALEASADPFAWPAPSLLATEHQHAGRGRHDRVWVTPPRSALTMSLLVTVPREVQMTLVPLMAGLAVCGAVREASALPTGLKWPNDVLVQPPGARDVAGYGGWRKVAGILVEVLPSSGGSSSAARAIVGIGANVHQRAADLPVDSATSLDAARFGDAAAPEGSDMDRTALAARIISSLLTSLNMAAELGPDPVLDLIAAETITLGRRVRIEHAGPAAAAAAEADLEGVAVGLSPAGELLLKGDDGALRAVAAGDVRHLRT